MGVLPRKGRVLLHRARILMSKKIDLGSSSRRGRLWDQTASWLGRCCMCSAGRRWEVSQWPQFVYMSIESPPLAKLKFCCCC
jgi:hypothetical protein